jgi:hypothetical protein
VALVHATRLMLQVCVSIARWPLLLMALHQSVEGGILTVLEEVKSLLSALRWCIRGLGKCVWCLTVGWLLWVRKLDPVLGWAYSYTPYHGRDLLVAWWRGYPSVDVLPGLYLAQQCASARVFMISGVGGG